MHKEEGALDKFYNANINLATGLQADLEEPSLIFSKSFLQFDSPWQAMNLFRPECGTECRALGCDLFADLHEILIICRRSLVWVILCKASHCTENKSTCVDPGHDPFDLPFWSFLLLAKCSDASRGREPCKKWFPWHLCFVNMNICYRYSDTVECRLCPRCPPPCNEQNITKQFCCCEDFNLPQFYSFEL